MRRANRFKLALERRRAWGRRGGRRSQVVQAAARLARGADADTVRAWALEDARGQVVAEGCDYAAGWVVPWRVVRSRRGRVNQVDLVVGSCCVLTGSWREVRGILRERV